MNKKLIIVGIGETAELAYGYFTFDSDYEVVAFAADKEFITSPKLHDLPVLPIADIKTLYAPKEYDVFVAVSSTKLNTLRERLYLMIKNMGYKMASYVSSRAYVGFNAEIGDNCFILEHNTIQPFCKIGNNVVMWSGNHIGHRSIIHDNCFISSHVVISGFCEVGKNCFLGVNTTIGNNLKIGDFCLLGQGCNIAKNVDDNSIYKMPYAQKQLIKAKQFYGIE